MGRAARRRRPAAISRMVATGLSASAVAGIVVALSHEQALAELRTAAAIVPAGVAHRHHLAVPAWPATAAAAPSTPGPGDRGSDRAGAPGTGAVPTLRAVPAAADRDAAPPNTVAATPAATTAAPAARPEIDDLAPGQPPAGQAVPAPGPASPAPSQQPAPAVPSSVSPVGLPADPAPSGEVVPAVPATAVPATAVPAAPPTTAPPASTPPSAPAPAPTPAPATTTTTAPPPLPTCSGSTCA